MATPTTTYSFSKPTVGGDDNAWGTELNNNLDKLDDLLDGTLSITPNLATGWEVGGVAVTSTAAELNILDGVTASTAEINILDGVTASTAEINILDGVTASTAELNVLDGISGIASQVEAEAGTAADKLMTPERTKQAIDALVPAAITLYSATTSTPDSTVTVIPVDTSAPLSTEGKQALSISSVVVASGQKVKVSFSGMISNSTNNVVTTLAVFRDTTCIGTAVTLTTTANLVEIVGATLVDDPGAGTYTYSLRFGPQSNTAYLNANALGQAIFGAAGRTDLVIEVL